MTDVAYNPVTHRYVMGWFELSSGALARVAEFDGHANLITQGVGSTKLGSYDAFSIAYNASSGTFLMVGVHGNTDSVRGIELNSRGFPFNGENTLSSWQLNRHPRVAASRSGKTFDVAFSGANFSSLASAIATSYSSNGGPSGSFDAPPAPSAPSTPSSPTVVSGGCTTIKPAEGWVCNNGNWLPPPDPVAPPPPPPPSSTPSSTQSTGCTTIKPGPDWQCVNGGWLPPQSAPLPAASTPPPPPPPPPSSSSTTACTTIKPGSDWVCVAGNWLPTSMASSASAPPSSPVPAPVVSTSGCVGAAPGAGWVCVQGNWVPSNHPLATSGGGNEP
jgi:hypothetical protein